LIPQHQAVKHVMKSTQVASTVMKLIVFIVLQIIIKVVMIV